MISIGIALHACATRSDGWRYCRRALSFYLSCDYHYQWQCLLVGGVWESVGGECGIARLLLAVVYCRTREGATQMMCVAKTGKTASAIL